MSTPGSMRPRSYAVTGDRRPPPGRPGVFAILASIVATVCVIGLVIAIVLGLVALDAILEGPPR